MLEMWLARAARQVFMAQIFSGAWGAGGHVRQGRGREKNLFGGAGGEAHGAGAGVVHDVVVGVGLGADGTGGVGEGGVEDDDFSVASSGEPGGGDEEGVGDVGGFEEFDVEAGGHRGALEAAEDGPAGGFVEDGGDDAAVEDAVPALVERVGFPAAEDAVAVFEKAEAEAAGIFRGAAEAVVAAGVFKGVAKGAASGGEGRWSWVFGVGRHGGECGGAGSG